MVAPGTEHLLRLLVCSHQVDKVLQLSDDVVAPALYAQYGPIKFWSIANGNHTCVRQPREAATMVASLRKSGTIASGKHHIAAMRCNELAPHALWTAFTSPQSPDPEPLWTPSATTRSRRSPAEAARPRGEEVATLSDCGIGCC